MPQKVRIWEVSSQNTLVEIARSDISQESQLEDWLENDISMLDDSLLVIGRQVRTDFDGVIDLLCLDRRGDTVTVELKKGKTPRDVTAQTLDYASWVRNLSFERISEIAEQYVRSSGSLDEAFKARFGVGLPDTLNQNHRSVIVAEAMDDSTERIVRYLADFGVPINIATVQHFSTNEGKEMLVQVFLVEPELAENMTRTTSKRRPYVTAGEMEVIADNNGVGDLYGHLSKGVSGLLSASSFGRTSRGFQHHSETGTLSLFVVDLEQSNQASGMRFRLNAVRMMKNFGLSEEQIRASLPEGSESMPSTDWRLATSEEKANWVGFRGYFHTIDDIDKFLSAIKTPEVLTPPD